MASSDIGFVLEVSKCIMHISNMTIPISYNNNNKKSIIDLKKFNAWINFSNIFLLCNIYIYINLFILLHDGTLFDTRRIKLRQQYWSVNITKFNLFSVIFSRSNFVIVIYSIIRTQILPFFFQIHKMGFGKFIKFHFSFPYSCFF